MNWKEYCLSFTKRIKKQYPRINIDNPTTFTDKIGWLKINDVTMLKTYCADKVTVRHHCKHCLNKEITIPTLAVYDTPEQIELSSLPDSFVIKCNHGSGMNIIVKNKSDANIEKIRRQLKEWLLVNYGDYFVELHYNLIPHKIIIEPYMATDENGLGDYRIYCFNGIPKLVSINFGFGHGGFNWYDMNGNLLPYNQKEYPADFSKLYEMPSCLDVMIEYATVLSKPFKLSRIDFFNINNIPYLSEMTFTPSAGHFTFTDPSINLEIGNMLKL